MGLIEDLKKGKLPENFKKIAQEERVEVDSLVNGVLKGEIVVPQNIFHKLKKPVVIGKGLRTKVNANIGTSEYYPFPQEEIKKLLTAIEVGTDTVMDLSTAGDLDKIRRSILKKSIVPLGTVPIYQAAIESIEKRGNIVEMKEDEIFEVIERQAKDGVDFMTIHAGVTLKTLDSLSKEDRVTGVVSRGGAFLIAWMIHQGKENPLYEQFERLLEISKKYEITISLGDGLRPGCQADASDRPQIQELIVLGELVDLARKNGVQVIVEGPGHVPINQIEANVRMEKEICRGAPFYVLGPLVTDVALGYDHITSAIGGALAAFYGADFLCYVTPREHLGLPTVEDVREGVVAARIAAHAADIAKGNKRAWEQDLEISKHRKNLNWEKQISLSIDPERAKKALKERRRGVKEETCSMCGKYCAMKIISQVLGVETLKKC